MFYKIVKRVIMNKVELLIKISKNKYYKYKPVRNSKYKRNLKKFKIRIIKNLDFRNDITLGSAILFNNFINKDRFVKVFN